MKKFLLLVCGLVWGGSIYAQQFPNVKVENQKGDVIETGSLVDNQTPMIVSFWSTTCKPCIKELDAVNDALEEWQEIVGKFQLVGVSIDDSRSVSRARAMAKGRGWDFTLLYDQNQDLKRAMNVVSTPQVFVYDKNGKQVYAHTGYTPGCEIELLNVLKKLK